MNTLIDLNSVGTPLKDLIEKKIEKADLPKCFGSMIPILIRIHEEFPVDELFAHEKSLPPDSFSDKNVKEVAPYLETESFLLTKKGEDKLEEYKEKKAIAYVQQLVNCAACQYYVRCDSLTKNYLKAIEIEQKIRG